MPSCGLCAVDSFQTVNGLYRHLQIHHHSKLSGVLQCMEPNCSRLNSNWKQLRRHLIRDHKTPLYVKIHPRSKPHSVENNSRLAVNLEDIPDNSVTLEACKSSDEEDVDSSKCSAVVLSQVTCLVSKLYANPSFPRNLIQNVVENVKSLLHETMESLVPPLAEIIKSNLDNDEKVFKITSLLGMVVRPMEETLSTEHLRLKYLKESGNFIEAEDYILGDRCDERYHRGRVILENVSVKGKYVPVKKSLSKFLSLPGVLNKIKSYHSRLKYENERGLISNFIQCHLWKEKVKSFDGKFVIPIFLYFDDFEVCNPLGSHAGIHKLGAVYYSLPSLPSEFQSTIDYVFLTLLFHASDRAVRDGNTYVFRKFIDDLNHLQSEGITVEVDGSSEKVYVSVGLLLADNKGFNDALGFAGGFSANFYCRFCTTHKSNMRSQFRENKNALRKVDKYLHDVQMGLPLSGVKEYSIWNSLYNFHVYENFSVDVLHDLLEGVCKTDMAIILKHYVAENKISLVSLNARINTFNYTLNNLKNKPPSFALEDIQEGRIKMSATELFHFVLLFSFYVSDLFNPDEFNDNCWQLYLTLREIVDIAFAKTLQVGHIKHFKNLVENHHRIRVENLKSPLKPKDHFLLHYSLIMEMSGPVSHLSTAKFESKHKTLKAMANSTSSRKNITHSICFKEQLNLCYRLTCQEELQVKIEMGPGEHFSELSLLDNFCLFSRSLPPEFHHKPFITVPWIKYKGITYHQKSVIAVDNDSESLQVFASIVTIMVIGDTNVCFLCKLLTTNSFEENLHAYSVSETCVYKCFPAINLTYPFVVIFHVMSSGQQYVTLKQLL